MSVGPLTPARSILAAASASTNALSLTKASRTLENMREGYNSDDSDHRTSARRRVLCQRLLRVGLGWAEFNRAKIHSDERWGVPGVFYLASRGREMAGSDGLSLAYRLPQLSDTEARGWRCHSQRWILTEVMADKLL